MHTEDKREEKRIRIALADLRCKESKVRQKFNAQIDEINRQQMELLAERERLDF